MQLEIKRRLSLRLTFLLFAVGSLLSTVTILYVCRKIAQFLLKPSSSVITIPFRAIVEWMVNQIGSVPIQLLVGVLLYTGIYLWLTQGTQRYWEQIRTAVTAVGSGDLDVALPVRGRGELAGMAEQFNKMTAELNSSLGQINSWLEGIAEGRLDDEIAAENSELAKVAKSINQMSLRLKQSIEEERLAERSKNDLITGVSHDLRTPLTSILGFLKAIEEDQYKDEVELRYYVNIAYEKARGLQKMIDDLFEYTRVNHGLPLHASTLDLNTFLHQLVEEFVPQLQQRGLQCQVTATEPPVLIDADGELLARAFENLLTNAIQYGAEGKRIDISIGQRGTAAVVQFINYGEAIPPGSLPHLFERFYRVDASRSKQTGGTGLGLAIAKSIIEAHGGHITVSSNQQRTVFEICFKLGESS